MPALSRARGATHAGSVTVRTWVEGAGWVEECVRVGRYGAEGIALPDRCASVSLS